MNEIKPDLILLDVTMPEIDGFEVCEILKNDENTKHIPIIFLTAKADMDSIIKGFETGGQDYITKPFNSAELLARVNTHILLREQKKQLKQIVIVLVVCLIPAISPIYPPFRGMHIPCDTVIFFVINNNNIYKLGTPEQFLQIKLFSPSRKWVYLSNNIKSGRKFYDMIPVTHPHCTVFWYT